MRFQLPFRSRRRIEREIDAEFAFHVEARAAQLISGGMAPEAARAQARAEFGDAAEAAAFCRTEDWAAERRQRRADWLADAALDMRHGVRQLRLRPGFAAAAALTLALGIGATTAIYTLVDRLVLRPLPYPHADRLVAVQQLHDGEPDPVEQISYGDFHDLRQVAGLFDGFAVFLKTGLTVTSDGPADRITAVAVSGDYFPLLGTRAAVGRLLTAADAAGEGAGNVVLSHSYWQSRYGGDSGVVGRDIRIDGRVATIVGVSAAGPPLAYPGGTIDAYLPLPETGRIGNRGFYGYYGFARRREGVRLEAVRSTLGSLGARYAEAYPNSNTGRSFTAAPLRTVIGGDARPAALALMGAAVCVLLIAAVNLANLLLARLVMREREFAVRVALGATRSRLVRQLLLEIAVLTTGGAGLGVVLAAAGLAAVRALAWPDALTAASLRLDGRVLAFTLLASAVSCLMILAGAALSRPERRLSALRGGARGTAGRSDTLVHRGLVAVETGLAFVLLVGAGLMLATMVAAVRTDPGFASRNLYAIRVAPPAARFSSIEEAAAYFERLATELRALPGVRAVALGSQIPLSGDRSGTALLRSDRPQAPGVAPPVVNRQVVSPGFFATLGIELLAGREFVAADLGQEPHRVVISDEVARRHFAGENPIGRRLGAPDGEDQHEIIGVVRAIRHHAMVAAPLAGVYELFGQHGGRQSALLIRSDLPPATLLPLLRAQVARFDPEAPLYAQATVDDLARRTMADQRTVLVLLGVFAGIALALAIVGIYGVTAQTVRARRREFGIRLALGAAPARVRRGVIGAGLGMTVAGVVAGALGAAATTRVLRGVLYGVAPLDPRWFGAAAMVLLLAALAAVAGPARRAAQVDVTGILRDE